MIKSLSVENFTAFNSLQIDFCPGVNIFLGANGTGKTHLMKLMYSACEITTSKKSFPEKIARVFLPQEEQIGRLVRRQKNNQSAVLTLTRESDSEKKRALTLKISFSKNTVKRDNIPMEGVEAWMSKPITSVFIPVKDMLANAPGFRSLYNSHSIHFEEIYVDIIDRAFYPILRGPIDRTRKRLLDSIQKAIEGKIKSKNEMFYLHNKEGLLEFTLLAEGMRKLGLLWLLIQNGTLSKGSVLFWDEPEANLNPSFIEHVVEILLHLHRNGTQIFVATHNDFVLKEFDAKKTESDVLLYHNFVRDPEGIKVRSYNALEKIESNPIEETYSRLLIETTKKTLASKRNAK